jgi:hypothetical protein
LNWWPGQGPSYAPHKGVAFASLCSRKVTSILSYYTRLVNARLNL